MTESGDRERERRVAANESLVRDINERIEKGARGSEGTGRTDFLCECPDYACNERLHMALADYQRIRSHPDWFVVLPGHETSGVERVVEEHKGYVVVEKQGVGAVVARERDPRA